MNNMSSKKETIQIYVRIRPSPNQKGTGSIRISNRDPPALSVVDRPQLFQFDKIFTEDANQQKIYDEAVNFHVQQVRNGFSSTVIAYGQSGTGKTYTMGTNAYSEDNDAGIIPRALEQLFDEINEDEVSISVSYLEIYREKVYDLFVQSKKPLTVSGLTVQNMNTKSVKNAWDAKALLEMGNKNRHVGETKQNMNSSRSHAIFTIHYSSVNNSSKTEGKLNFVDLAGSESLKKTLSQGSTFQEGININKGLLYIGQVISAISDGASYIPYRQSMITTILQSSLTGENYISLIACISSQPEDVTETLQTLDFTQKTKRIKKLAGFARTPMKRPLFTPMKTLPKVRPVNETDFSIFSVDMTQQVLSPIMRKYFNEYEERLLSRLSSVGKRRLTRTSIGLINKENVSPNTPYRRLNAVIPEPAQVKSEVSQLTDQAHKETIATSSPIDTKELSGVIKLSCGTPVQNSQENKDMWISPIPTVLPPKTPRRSLRVSLKAQQREETMDETLEVTERHRTTRRSCCGSVRKVKNETIKNKKAVKRQMPKVKGYLMDSPFTIHKREVLQTLNYGKKSDIQKLYSIGPKTAEQILTYRTLNGRFEVIDDVAQLPGWTLKKFHKFLDSNMLQKL